MKTLGFINYYRNTHKETATTSAQKLFPKTFRIDYINFTFSNPES